MNKLYSSNISLPKKDKTSIKEATLHIVEIANKMFKIDFVSYNGIEARGCFSSDSIVLSETGIKVLLSELKKVPLPVNK